MQMAIALSFEGMRALRGGPFGAVVVKEGTVLGASFNRVLETNDPTAHAEICAIREACKAVGAFHLEGAVLYTSCEPCPMCLGAAYWARIGTIFYGNTRDDAEMIGFSDSLLYSELQKAHSEKRIAIQQFMQREAFEAFQEWLKAPNKNLY